MERTAEWTTEGSHRRLPPLLAERQLKSDGDVAMGQLGCVERGSCRYVRPIVQCVWRICLDEIQGKTKRQAEKE